MTRPTPSIMSIRAYEGGKPVEEVKRGYGIEQIVKLASNENPLGPPKAAQEAMIKAAREAHMYPDGNAYYLKNDLAARLNIEPNHLLIGNGSCDALQILAETFLSPGDEIVFSDQSFVMYPILAKIFNAKAATAPLQNAANDMEALAELIKPTTKIAFIANPNNPTGTYVNKRQMDRFFDAVPEGPIVVLDEAYFEYAQTKPDYPDGMEYLRQGRNVVVTRTFSKAYGLAGLRVGYAVAPPQIIDWMNRVRQPFNANIIAQAAARAALQDAEHVERSRAVNRKGLAYLTRAFDELGVQYEPSAANFILAHTGRPSKALAESLMRQGVIVRPMSEYRFPQSIRATIGLPSQNELLATALARSFERLPKSEPDAPIR